MEESPKAYKEIYEILKYIPKKELEKVPTNFIKFIENNMDKEYEYKVKNVRDFEKQEMLRETRVILAILYRDCWATDEKRKEILEKQKKEIFEDEEEKRKQYDVENMFKRKKELNKDTKEENIELARKQESIIKNIINKIKEFFRRK